MEIRGQETRLSEKLIIE